MRRPRLIQLATVASMVFWVVTLAMWSRSMWVENSIWWGSQPVPTSNGYHRIVHGEFRLGSGVIYWERANHESKNSAYLASVSASGTDTKTSDTGGFVPTFIPTFLGFAFGEETSTGAFRSYDRVYVAIPLWCFLVLTAMLPLARYGPRPDERGIRLRTYSPRCKTCNCKPDPISGVCPECGMSAPENREAAL